MSRFTDDNGNEIAFKRHNDDNLILLFQPDHPEPFMWGFTDAEFKRFIEWLYDAYYMKAA